VIPPVAQVIPPQASKAKQGQARPSIF